MEKHKVFTRDDVSPLSERRSGLIVLSFQLCVWSFVLFHKDT